MAVTVFDTDTVRDDGSARVDRDDVFTLTLACSLVGVDVCAGVWFGWLVAVAGFFTLTAVWSAATLGLFRRR